MVRELKCPYGDDFEGGDECDRCEQYELCMETYPPVNLIEIPKGATNGDMIKAMFPNAEYLTDNCNSYYMRPLNEQGEWGARFGWEFDLAWWNAPYKRGEGE